MKFQTGINLDNKKVIIGMNQIDLWSGGQQLNRGSKYILNKSYDTNVKILCVVCANVNIKSKNKIYNLFRTGFKNNTICYLKNLKNIIKNYLE